MSTVTAQKQLSLVERAKALVPAISERAAQVEEMRHVHEDSIIEMQQAGLFRSMSARRNGGEEASSADFMAAVIEISKACTSTGWVLCILSAHNWEMAHMSLELQDEIYADNPDMLLSSSYAQQGNKAVRVPGGYRVTGKWKSSSGIHHVGWVVLGVDIEGEAPHNIVVPRSDFTEVDDWHVLGMQGTGSRTVVLDDVFIPAHRAIDREVLVAGFGPGMQANTAPLFRVPQAHIYSSVAAAPALGAAWRFYDEFPGFFGQSSTLGGGRQIADDPRILLSYAEARGLITAQEHLFLHRHEEAYDSALTGQPLDELTIAEAMFDIAKSGRTALEVATTLMPLLRPSAVYHKSIVQRLYRDIVVARQHGTQDTTRAGEVMGLIQQDRPAAMPFIVPPAQTEKARRRAAELGYLAGA